MSGQALDFNLPSPLEPVFHPLLSNKKINLWVKRDDKIHPEISGNKYRKLKYNLVFPETHEPRTIITFGGAFSNHLHATAALCFHLGLPSIGIVRGEAKSSENPTLAYCMEKNMVLHFVSREDYRMKEDSPVIKDIIASFPNAFLIPEGGGNAASLLGIQEIWKELSQQIHELPDYVFCSAGTGYSLAGLLSFLPKKCQLLGFSSLKSKHLEQQIWQFAGKKPHNRFHFFTNYHFGGYAKITPELLAEMSSFEHVTGIPLDPVYNGKAVIGFLDLVVKNYFPENCSIVWIHTGGLQGNRGYEYMRSVRNK